MITERAAFRPLIAKAWLETRNRFLGSAIVLTLLGLSTVVRASSTIEGWERFHSGEKMPYALYVWLSLSHGYLQFIWIICAVILGLGGLLREQSLGTASFTLGLPISRWNVVVVRALVGAAELLLLAAIPGVLVTAFSPLTAHSFPLIQSLMFASLIAGAGIFFYALSFTLAHLLSSDYAAPSVALAATAALYVLTKLPHMSPLNIFELMTGARFMNPWTYMLDRGYPMLPISLCVAVSFLMVRLSYRTAASRDF